MVDPFAAYELLVRRIDAHSERVTRQYTDQFSCSAGCSSCCYRQLTVFPVEAERIRRWVEEQGGLAPYEPDQALAVGHPALLLAVEEPACKFLDAAGRCRIYPVRPVLCRTHGLPLAIDDGEGAVYGDVCPLNFAEGEGLAAVPAEDFLSLEVVNTTLVTLNARFVAGGNGGSDVRVALAELASTPA